MAYNGRSMKRMTTRCALHGHREFELDVGMLDETMTGGLVGYLERSVANGVRFEEGQSIQFGFQLLEVREAGPNLTLHAPEPRSIEHAVVATLRQRFVVESFGLDDVMDFPNPRSTALACRRAGIAEETAVLRARVLGEGASGWMAVCADPDHDHTDPRELEWLPVQELTQRLPILHLFVAMPPGTAVTFGSDGVRMVKVRGAELAPDAGSFVAELAQRESWPLARPIVSERNLS
jgi:hypothetical protein